MPKKNASEAESKKTAAPSFKSLVRMINNGDKPRGLKVKKNEAGGYTFSYGTKSAPISVIASADEVVAAGLAAFGLKLS